MNQENQKTRMRNIRRHLRKNQTNEENILWQRVRRKKLGARIHRQYSFGTYVVDFYCPEAKLVIELLGQVHKENIQKEYDKVRYDFLVKQGLFVICVWNSTIMKNLEKFLIDVELFIETRDRSIFKK
jgi:very-short-patch-repair endonuclease